MPEQPTTVDATLGIGSWREPVMRRMLNAAALTAPPLIAIPLLLPSAQLTGLDVAVFVAAGAVPVIIRLARVGPVAGGAAALVSVVLFAGLFAMARVPFGAGGAVAVMTGVVLASLFYGRRAGLLCIALATAALLALGGLATTGHLGRLAGEANPLLFRTWFRKGFTTSLMGALLALAVDAVIRHVEAAASAASSALSRLRLAYQRLEHLNARLEAAKENERGALSSELRGGLAETLSALKLRLQMESVEAAGLAAGRSEPVREFRAKLSDTLTIVDELIGRVRRMSGDLRPPLLDEVGLVRALRAYLEEQAVLSGLTFDLEAHSPGGGDALPPEMEIACFRVVQESITNVLRHAEAKHVRVRLERSADRLSLVIEDDGAGFDPAAPHGTGEPDQLGRPRPGHRGGPLGIIGMRERVGAWNGAFDLRSRPGTGTTVEISLPIPGTGAGPLPLRRSVSGAPPPAVDEHADAVAIGAWRTHVQRATLTAAALVTPLLAALGLFAGASRRDAIDVGVVATSGLLLPALRLANGISARTRVHAAIGALFLTGVYALARAGYGTGASVLQVATSLTAVICLRRGVGFVVIGASLAAHLVVGLLVTKGVLHQASAEISSARFFHWARLAAVIALVGGWLTVVLDFVIRQIDANARTAMATLGELQVAYHRLGQLHGRLEATREEERRFLAHELHDELGQTLTAIKLRLQVAGRARQGVGASGGAVVSPEALAVVDQLIALVRRISAELRPPLLDEVGLYPAIRAFVESQASGTRVALELCTDPGASVPRLGPTLEIIGFRVVQEAVTNALRHAGAKAILVDVRGTDDGAVRVAVRDDGRGFDPGSLERSEAGGRLGLVGLRERIRAVGGSFSLVSRGGAGTTVEVELGP